jgi:hypothetical protein
MHAPSPRSALRRVNFAELVVPIPHSSGHYWLTGLAVKMEIRVRNSGDELPDQVLGE